MRIKRRSEVKPATRFIRIKTIYFYYDDVFNNSYSHAGLTIFALTFGDEKVVEVAVPVEREEFSQTIRCV